MPRPAGGSRLAPALLAPAALTLVSLVSLVSLLSLSGCGSDGRVVARVGSQVITAEEFRDLAEAAAPRSFMPPDTAKRRLLEQLIDRSLLLLVADARPPLPDSVLASRRAAVEEDALARALVQRLAPGEVGVSDAEVARYYTMRGEATHARVVFAPDESIARAAMKALRHGEDFGSVATRFDITGQLPPGGDLGFVQPGMLVSPIDGIVRDAAVGSVTGPVESPGQGWFIVHIIAREHREQPPLATEAPELRRMIEQRKQRSFALKRYTDLRNTYAVTIDRAGVRRLYERHGMPQQMREMSGEPETPLTAEEARTVLGRWDAGGRFTGVYTLGDAEADFREQKGGRIDGRQTIAFEQWTRNRVLQRVALIEARRRHLQDEPDVAQVVRQTIDNELLQAVYQTEIVDKAEPTEAEVRDVYDRNLEAFSELKAARLQYMTLPDSSAAARALEHVRMTGASLRDAVLLSSASLRVQEETVRFPSRERLWDMLQPSLLHERVGTTLGPFHVESGWRIVHLAERDVNTTPFDALDDDTREGLRREAVQIAAQRRLATVTDSLRRTIPVIVNEAVLKSIPWPAPAGMTILPG